MTDPTRPTDDVIERILRAGTPRELASEDRARRVEREVREAWRDTVRTRARRRWLIKGGFGLAAAATVAAALWIAPRVLDRSPASASAAIVARKVATNGPSPVPDDIRAGDTIRTDGTSRATFLQEGGGELRVDVNTALRLDAGRRVQLERGALYVQSAGSPPTTVVTRQGEIVDIGTRFEVRVADDILRIRVRDGLVRFDQPNGQRHDAPAGSELVVAKDGALARSERSPFADVWNWTTLAAPVFDVEGARLSAFLQWVATEGGRTIDFRNARLSQSYASTVLHGSIRGLTVDQALAVVLPTCGLTHRVEDKRIIVERATGDGR